VSTPAREEYASASRRCSPWQHFGNTRPSRPVRCVQKASQSGRSEHPRTHIPRMNRVEGLVDRMVRGGSSPLGRTKVSLFEPRWFDFASLACIGERPAFRGSWCSGRSSVATLPYTGLDALQRRGAAVVTRRGLRDMDGLAVLRLLSGAVGDYRSSSRTRRSHSLSCCPASLIDSPSSLKLSRKRSA
jgi:hypothetical protein